MSSGRNIDYAVKVGDLFDLLAAEPDGLDAGQIAEKLSVSKSSVHGIVRRLRLQLGGGDSINVPVRNDSGRWLYFLAGSPADGSEWQAIRTKTLLSRLDIDRAWWRSMATGTDGRTRDGRIARTALKHFDRLAEDVEEIHAEVA